MTKNFNEIIADAIRSHSFDLLRLSNGQRKRVMRSLKALESRMIASLAAAGIDSTGTPLPKQSPIVRSILAEVDRAIVATFSQIEKEMQSVLADTATYEAQFLTKTINAHGDVELVKNVLTPSVGQRIAMEAMIQGAPSEDWWKRQSLKLQNDFADEMRRGMDAGDNLQQLVQRVRGGTRNGVVVKGIMTTSRSNAEALVRSSFMSVASESRRELYQGNSDVVKGIQQISTLDDRTTPICVAYAGATWDLDYNPLPPNKLPYLNGVPRHWNCRSAEVPLIKSFSEILGVPGMSELPASTRASMDGQVPDDLSFGDWIKRKELSDSRFADKLLGTTKAQLWRDGKITLTDLVNDRGEEKTIEQLRREAGL